MSYELGITAVGSASNQTQGIQNDAVGTPFITDQVTPTPSPRGSSILCSADCNRASTCDDPDAPTFWCTSRDDQIAVINQEDAVGPTCVLGPLVEDLAIIGPIESSQSEADDLNRCRSESSGMKCATDSGIECTISSL